MRWLVTGGCGFIGRGLIADLVREGGHAVRVVDDLSVGSREDLAAVSPFTEVSAASVGPLPPKRADVELVVGDVRDEALAPRVAAGADVIVHLAANTGVQPSLADPHADCLANVIGTLNYLEAARRSPGQRFVFASSGAPVGEREPPIHEELAPRPASPYGASKLAGEGYCSAYWRSFGVPTVALRFGNVYGPLSAQKNSVVAKFIRAALAGEPWEIWGDGRQTRDFIYIDDLVRAVRRAAEVDGIGGEIFQIATSAETTVQELARALADALTRAGVPRAPVTHAPAPPGEVRRSFSDTSKAARVLRWKAEVPLERGLERTVAWFLERSGAARRTLA
jgi:UDP-glucose 4-epimerase